MKIPPEHDHGVEYLDGSLLEEGAIINSRRLIFSGRMRAGKDYVAEQLGLPIYGFADPIYLLTEAWVGSQDKTLSGVRRAMQKIGAWGRGIVSEAYPLTRERHRFCEWAQVHGPTITGMGTGRRWAQFGQDWDPALEEMGHYPGHFWIELLQDRVRGADEYGITNGRFPNEIWAFSGGDKGHIHVMCSEETRRARTNEAGEAWDPDAENDTTEQMAAQLDEYVYAGGEEAREAVMKKYGLGNIVGPDSPPLTVVWNDPRQEPDFPESGMKLDSNDILDLIGLAQSPLIGTGIGNFVDLFFDTPEPSEDDRRRFSELAKPDYIETGTNTDTDEGLGLRVEDFATLVSQLQEQGWEIVSVDHGGESVDDNSIEQQMTHVALQHADWMPKEIKVQVGTVNVEDKESTKPSGE